MLNVLSKPRKSISKIIFSIVLVSFCGTSLGMPAGFAAGTVPLPQAHALAPLSARYTPPLLVGIQFYPDNPLKFDFIINKGDDALSADALQAEAGTLIRYFLAALTIPENDLWVNLSPYEHDRIVPDALGMTEMGQELLGQDYMLKQLAASMTYPESPLGKTFWSKAYARMRETFGVANIPLNTFNKIWIVPNKADIYEDADKAILGDASLKVMMEADYAAQQKVNSDQRAVNSLGVNSLRNARRATPNTNDISTQLMREVVVPVIQEDVNNGKNFAVLRQMYAAMLLAVWFKHRLRDTLIRAENTQRTPASMASVFSAFVDKNKTKGVEGSDPASKEKIYKQYVEAYKKGVYDYIKKEYSQASKKQVRRRYFSGGFLGPQMHHIAAHPKTDFNGVVYGTHNRQSSAHYTFQVVLNDSPSAPVAKVYKLPLAASVPISPEHMKKSGSGVLAFFSQAALPVANKRAGSPVAKDDKSVREFLDDTSANDYDGKLIEDTSDRKKRRIHSAAIYQNALDAGVIKEENGKRQFEKDKHWEDIPFVAAALHLKANKKLYLNGVKITNKFVANLDTTLTLGQIKQEILKGNITYDSEKKAFVFFHGDYVSSDSGSASGTHAQHKLTDEQITDEKIAELLEGFSENIALLDRDDAAKEEFYKGIAKLTLYLTRTKKNLGGDAEQSFSENEVSVFLDGLRSEKGKNINETRYCKEFSGELVSVLDAENKELFKIEAGLARIFKLPYVPTAVEMAQDLRWVYKNIDDMAGENRKDAEKFEYIKDKLRRYLYSLKTILASASLARNRQLPDPKLSVKAIEKLIADLDSEKGLKAESTTYVREFEKGTLVDVVDKTNQKVFSVEAGLARILCLPYIPSDNEIVADAQWIMRNIEKVNRTKANREQFERILIGFQRYLAYLQNTHGANVVRQEKIDAFLAGLRGEAGKNLNETRYAKEFRGEMSYAVNDQNEHIFATDQGFLHIFGFFHRTAEVILKTHDGKKVILILRPDNRIQGGKLSLPGGNVRAGMSDAAYARQIIKESFGLPHLQGNFVQVGANGQFKHTGNGNNEFRSVFAYRFTKQEEDEFFRQTQSNLEKKKSNKTALGFNAELYAQQRINPKKGTVGGYYEASVDDIVGKQSMAITETFDHGNDVRTSQKQYTDDLLIELFSGSNLALMQEGIQKVDNRVFGINKTFTGASGQHERQASDKITAIAANISDDINTAIQVHGLSADEYEYPFNLIVPAINNALQALYELWSRGEIDPSIRLHVCQNDHENKPEDLPQRELKIGVYPIAADPMQWGHVIIALTAAAKHGYDKIILVPAGDDERKADLPAAALRHAMLKIIAAMFGDLVVVSDMSSDSTLDGEYTYMRIMEFFKGIKVRADYLFGGDHYLRDKNSGASDVPDNPDTIRKAEDTFKHGFRYKKGPDGITRLTSKYIVKKGKKQKKYIVGDENAGTLVTRDPQHTYRLLCTEREGEGSKIPIKTDVPGLVILPPMEEVPMSVAAQKVRNALGEAFINPEKYQKSKHQICLAPHKAYEFVKETIDFVSINAQDGTIVRRQRKLYRAPASLGVLISFFRTHKLMPAGSKFFKLKQSEISTKDMLETIQVFLKRWYEFQHADRRYQELLVNTRANIEKVEQAVRQLEDIASLVHSGQASKVYEYMQQNVRLQKRFLEDESVAEEAKVSFLREILNSAMDENDFFRSAHHPSRKAFAYDLVDILFAEGITSFSVTAQEIYNASATLQAAASPLVSDPGKTASKIIVKIVPRLKMPTNGLSIVFAGGEQAAFQKFIAKALAQGTADDFKNGIKAGYNFQARLQNVLLRITVTARKGAKNGTSIAIPIDSSTGIVGSPVGGMMPAYEAGPAAENFGGIDFNANNVHMRIKGSSPVQLPISGDVNIDFKNFAGFGFTIIGVSEIKDIRQAMGIIGAPLVGAPEKRMVNSPGLVMAQ